jgi:sulfite reductase beta subunit-like hemoprotein
MENEVLLHKFKIALGGCPNNCVKPDLNDSLLKTNLNKKIGQQMSFRIEGQHLFAFMETKIENLIIKKN